MQIKTFTQNPGSEIEGYEITIKFLTSDHKRIEDAREELMEIYDLSRSMLHRIVRRTVAYAIREVDPEYMMTGHMWTRTELPPVNTEKNEAQGGITFLRIWRNKEFLINLVKDALLINEEFQEEGDSHYDYAVDEKDTNIEKEREDILSRILKIQNELSEMNIHFGWTLYPLTAPKNEEDI